MKIKGILKSKALIMLISFLAICCAVGVIQTNVTYGASQSNTTTQYVSKSGYSIQTPVLLSAYGDNGGVTITWEKSEGAEQYRISRKTADSNWKPVGTIPATQNSFKDTSAKPGTTYTYTVRAMDSAGKNYTSNFDSKGLSVAYVATPTISSLTRMENGVKVSWNAVKGAAQYRIYRHTGDGNLTKVTTVAGTSYTDTGLASGKNYYYRVRCVDSSGSQFTSGFTTNDRYIYYVKAPKLVSVSSVNGGVTITWEKVNGASNYRISRKTGNGNWQPVGTISSSYSTFTDTSAHSNTTYTYTVRSMDRAKKGYTSAFDSDGLRITHVAAPTVSSLARVENGIKVSWKAVPGAQKYRLYRHTGDGKLTVVATVSGTSYTDTSVSSGKNYYYRLRCVDSTGKNFTSGYTTKDKYVYYVKAPSLTSVYGNNGGVIITWEKVNGASNYRISRKTGNGNWQPVGTISANYSTFKDTTAKPGTNYTYTVRSMDRTKTSYTSAFDSDGLQITYVATPSVSSLKEVEHAVRIEWNSIPLAEEYRIYRHTGDNELTVVGTTDSTSFTDTTVVSGTTYYYRIRCVNSGGNQFTSGYLTEDKLSIRYLGDSTEDPDLPEVDPPMEENKPDFSNVPRQLSLEAGDTYSLSESEIGCEIELSTSDRSVVRVSGTTISAYGAGTATVTVTAGGESIRIRVTVNESTEDPEIEINLDYSSMNLTVGSSRQQVAMVTRQPGTPIALSWESSDETVATVTPTTSLSARVQAVGVGTAEISVSTNGVTETFPVTVTSEATLNQTNLTLNVQETYQLEVDGNYGSINWSSSNPRVITVEEGLLTAINAGTATITASFDNTSLSCTVTVTETSADKTELQSLYSEASELLADAVLESYRTPESWNALESAAQSAQTILEGTGANQEQVDLAAEQLSSAMDGLEAYTYSDGELVFYEEQSKQILDEINAFRSDNGLSELTWNDNYARRCLAQGAYNAITYGLNYEARNSSWSPADHSGAFIGCCFYGRNVNSYQAVADTVLETFVNSAGHRANLLDSRTDLQYAGVSFCSYNINGRNIFVCIVEFGRENTSMSAGDLGSWYNWNTFDSTPLTAYGCTYEELYYMVG